METSKAGVTKLFETALLHGYRVIRRANSLRHSSVICSVCIDIDTHLCEDTDHVNDFSQIN